MMTLWTGSIELHSTSDGKIGPNEEERVYELDLDYRSVKKYRK